MRSDHLQTNFTAGEISPEMLGRSDIARYNNGASKVRNMVVRPHGGVAHRPGTSLVGLTKYGTEQVFLYRFEFSDTQAYLLEFGRLYIRIYKDDGLLTSGGFAIEVVTPYTDVDWDRLTFSQSADTLFITHPDHQPRLLTRYSNTDWRMSLYEATDGPYMGKVFTDVTLTLSNVAATAVVTLNVAPVTAVIVGNYIEFREEGEWRLGKVAAGGVTSTTQFTVEYFLNVLRPVGYSTFSSSDTAASSSPSKVSPYVKISYVAAGPPLYTISADHDGVFNNYDVGKYLRATTPANASPAWFLLTLFYGVASSVQSMQGTTDLVRNNLIAASTFATLDTNGCVGTLESKSITATVTASSALFVSTDVGRHIRLNYSGDWCWCKITGYTSSTVVSVSMESDPAYDPNQRDSRSASNLLFTEPRIFNNGVTSDFKMGAWSDSTGWPSHSKFHQDRLVFARTEAEPQTFWLSGTGDYYNHAVSQLDSTVLDTDAITATLLSAESSEIVWVSPGPVLLIGTVSEEWQIRPASSSINDALTPTNTRAISQSPIGAKPGSGATRIENSVVFIQRHGFKLYEMSFNFQVDGYETNDLTIISEHILAEGGVGLTMALQKQPHQLLWIVTTSGKLACLTFEKKQDVVGWSFHDLGGCVESAVALPDVTKNQDSVYFSVCRVINGVEQRYIEKLERAYDPRRMVRADVILTDSTITYTGAPATVISGLSHLEGEDVDVVADGAYVGSHTVVSGALTLEVAAQKVHVGLPVLAYVETLPPQGQGVAGTTAGMLRTPTSAALLLSSSAGVYYGQDLDTTYRLGTGADFVYGDAPELESGWKVVPLMHASSRSGTIVFKASQPYPVTILAYASSGQIGNYQV